MEVIHSPFVFIGNNLAVDFINTEIVFRGNLVDLLQADTALNEWARDAHLNLESGLSLVDLASVRDFRASLKSLYAAKIDNMPLQDKALEKINRHLALYSKPLVLSFSKNEYLLQPIQDTLTIENLLKRIAYEGATLLASSMADRLKRCSNPDCILIFLDTSRNQKRRWCSMDTCGNRSKVSTHYKKINSDNT